MRPLTLDTTATRLPVVGHRKGNGVEPGPLAPDSVTLGTEASGAGLKTLVIKPQSALKVTGPTLTRKGLTGTAEAAAEHTAAGMLGGLFSTAVGWVKTFFKTQKFAVDFLRDMRARAEEITREPDRVEEHLKTQGLHHEYQAPVNPVNVKLRGKMLIKASMKEFFELWNHWIAQGYGSINDRKYADLVLKFRDQAQGLPLLAYLPMTSEDVFSAEIKNGRMIAMDEVTTAKLLGAVPTSKVSWAYRRHGEPTASNSFERAIDQHNGDLEAVQRFYQKLFDPKQANPESKATVTFTLEEVKDLELPVSATEFQHNVKAPLSALIPKKASTLDGQLSLARAVSGQLVSGAAVAVH